VVQSRFHFKLPRPHPHAGPLQHELGALKSVVRDPVEASSCSSLHKCLGPDNCHPAQSDPVARLLQGCQSHSVALGQAGYTVTTALSVWINCSPSRRTRKGHLGRAARSRAGYRNIGFVQGCPCCHSPAYAPGPAMLLDLVPRGSGVGANFISFFDQKSSSHTRRLQAATERIRLNFVKVLCRLMTRGIQHL